MVMPLTWALLAGVALVLSWATASVHFAWAGYLMLALLVLGFVMARLGEQGLVAHRDLSTDRVHFGERVQVDVKVENRGLMPAIWVVAAEALPAGLPVTGSRGRVVPLAGKRTFSFSYSLEGARRGYHAIGPTAIRTGDLFGLFHRQRAPGGPSHLTVFPKLVPITHARFASRRPAGDARTRQRVWEDPSQTIGIRPYQRGDSLRRVHWRATAHTGKLQSRLFQVTAQIDTMVLLNLRRSDYPMGPDDAGEAAELAISTAASIARHVLDRGQRVGLVALARDPASGGISRVLTVKQSRGRDQLSAILSVLGRIELGQTDGLLDTINREKESFPWGSLVVVVTPVVDREVLPVLLDLRTSGFEVKVVVVGRGAFAPRRAGMDMMGIGAARVRSENDIRGLDI
jgi:uncharacterized protein (DUF58 family)